LIDAMFEAMEEEKGVGLAAPQIGQSLRVVVINTRQDRERIALINPKIVKESPETSEFTEGCLSVPGIEGLIIRPKAVKVRALTPEGKRVEISDDDLLARVLQHEIDHLNGILFVDRLSDQDKLRVQPDLDQLKRGAEPRESKGVAGAVI
jgi:peptide deformylase